MTMKVGDHVNYVTHEIHSKCIVPKITGDPRSESMPWVFGWRERYQKRDRQGNPLPAEVAELNHAETLEKMAHIKRQAPAFADAEKKKLVMLRPRHFWDAVVTAVSSDGARANLDISDPTTGATLHYKNIVIDPLGTTPDSCHEKPAAKTAAAQKANGFHDEAKLEQEHVEQPAVQ